MEKRIINYSKVEIIQKNPPTTDIAIISETYHVSLREMKYLNSQIGLSNCEISPRYLSVSREKWPIYTAFGNSTCIARRHRSAKQTSPSRSLGNNGITIAVASIEEGILVREFDLPASSS